MARAPTPEEIARIFRPVGSPSFFADPLINVPLPGDVDTGGITGVIVDILGGLIGGRGPAAPILPQAPSGPLPQLPTNGPFTLGGAIPPTNGCGCLPLGGPALACCKGFHLNKATGCDGTPPGSKCVRNRRMNALNPRALRRATSRLKGFERAVKTTRKQLRTLAKI